MENPRFEYLVWLAGYWYFDINGIFSYFLILHSSEMVESLLKKRDAVSFKSFTKVLLKVGIL